MAMGSQEKPNVVIDFDGTLTDLDRETENYFAPFYRGIAGLTGTTVSKVEQLFHKAYAEIDKNPGLYGWEINGIFVAPIADPYLRNNAATTLVLGWLGKQIAFSDLVKLHQACQVDLPTLFKPGAKEFVETLQNETDFSVVTNSHPDLVVQKLSMLLENHSIRVIGNAKKYNLDQTWNAVSPTVQHAGFPRPVYLRRKAYGDVLNSIMKSEEGQYKIQCVVGDIYELDLALPEHLGIQTILVTTPNWTPRWEVEHYRNHPNGMSSDNLLTIAQHVIALTSREQTK